MCKYEVFASLVVTVDTNTRQLKQTADRHPVRVGTSGYSYPEWVDAGFYPAGTRPGRMLALYAQRFSATELNYTWYQMPKAAAIDRMRRQVPSDFHFAVKLTRTMTHEVDRDQWRGQVVRYRDGVAPLVLSGQLAAVLLQLPASFERTRPRRHYLAALLEELAGLPLAVEFRHVSWATDRVFAELEKRRVTLVTVDAPPLPHLFPPLDVITNAELVYVRLHGRNAAGWRSGNMQKQFDYCYGMPELNAWAETRIAALAGRACRGLVFFNNHVRAQAPANARQLVALLAKQGLAEAPSWNDTSSI